MYESVDAVTDCPPNIFWEEILQAFPDAKVILTTRDEEQWYKSLLKQMQAFLNNYIYGFMQIVSPTGRKYFTFFRNVVRSLWGSDMRHPRDSSAVDNQMVIRKAFRQHGKYCEQNCPPGKLLVYDVRQGWAPLCKFLGKEIPDKPFPHENVAGNVVDQMMAIHPALIRMQRETAVITLLLSLGLLFGSYKLYNSNRSAFASKLYSVIKRGW